MTYYTTKLHTPQNKYEEALLNLVATSEIIRKIGDRFFCQFDLTRSQFNILVLLKGSGQAGLTQVQIGREMIVTASNISTHLARLEKMGLVVRKPLDRRTNSVRLTPKALEKLKNLDDQYNKRVKEVMSVLDKKELDELARMLFKLREKLR
jgi:DNA-binding MarR family transcriptional regulator